LLPWAESSPFLRGVTQPWVLHLTLCYSLVARKDSETNYLGRSVRTVSSYRFLFLPGEHNLQHASDSMWLSRNFFGGKFSPPGDQKKRGGETKKGIFENFLKLKVARTRQDSRKDPLVHQDSCPQI
jgi:hypothetical protein